MKLTEVMQGVAVKDWEGTHQAEVSGLAYESGRVGPGSLFCTWKGFRKDGHAYIPDAVKRGAVAVVAEKKLTDVSIPNIRVENGRRALGRMAANFYGHPSKDLQVVGVTGTNGKTSTSMLLQSLFQSGGFRCGLWVRWGTIWEKVGRMRATPPRRLPIFISSLRR
jgi:UDP-N-acetylmuramoyl-L-alanyl-D-glutamate--2,6-diaminopimelate ligase